MAFENENLFGDPITEEYFRRKASSQIAPAQLQYTQALSRLRDAPMRSGEIVYGEELAGRERARQDIATGLASKIAAAQSAAESANIATAADQRTRARVESLGLRDELERMRWGAGTKLLQAVPDTISVMGSLDEKAREASGKGILELVEDEEARLAELSIKRNQDPDRRLIGGGGRASGGTLDELVRADIAKRDARSAAGTPWYEGVPEPGSEGAGRGIANVIHQKRAEAARAEAALANASPEDLAAAEQHQGQGLGMKLNQDGTGSISPSQIPSDELIIEEGRRQGLSQEQIGVALAEARRARGGGISPLSGLQGVGVGGGLYRDLQIAPGVFGTRRQ